MIRHPAMIFFRNKMQKNGRKRLFEKFFYFIFGSVFHGCYHHHS